MGAAAIRHRRNSASPTQPVMSQVQRRRVSATAAPGGAAAVTRELTRLRTRSFRRASSTHALVASKSGNRGEPL